MDYKESRFFCSLFCPSAEIFITAIGEQAYYIIMERRCEKWGIFEISICANFEYWNLFIMPILKKGKHFLEKPIDIF